MKASILIAALAAAWAAAGPVNVVNNCPDPVYVQSVAWKGAASGPLTPVPANGGVFSEDFRLTGSTVKISKLRTLDTPPVLFFGYSFSAALDFAYYELSAEFGNPFADRRNVLSPGPGCVAFDCPPNAPDCYSTPTLRKVYGCPLPVVLNATLCAA